MRKIPVRLGLARWLLVASFAASAGVGLQAVPARAAAQCPSVSSVGTVTPAPQPGVDWSGCDLSGANLRYVNMWQANLSYANLTGATMNAGHFGSVNFTGANLSGAVADAVLSNANLTDANFSGAQAGAQFDGADLQGAQFASADLTGAESGNVTGVPASIPPSWHLVAGYLIGPGADLAGAQLGGLDLGGYDLSNVNLYGATLTGTNLAQANLAGVFSGHITTVPAALPTNWVIKYGFLIGPRTNLYAENLSGDNLSGLDLAGAFLMLANLTNANLAGADLRRADLSKATVTGADLTGVDLSTSNLTRIYSGRIAGAPVLPAGWRLTGGYLVGPWADLTGANLAGLDLSGADLNSAFLEVADLTNADLNGADLRYADFYLAKVAGATFTGATWLSTNCPNGTDSNLYVDGCFSALDTAPPIAHPVITGGSLGLNGWYTSPVTVTWNWSDDGAVDVSRCDSTSTTSTQGNPVQLPATCTDLAGNQGSATYNIRVDQTPPTVTVTGVASGRTYVIGLVPAPGCTTTDDLSGVGALAKLTVTTTGSHGVGSFTATCAGAADSAGNLQAAPVSVTYKVAYGFGGFISPKPGSAIAKSARKFAVTFRLTNGSGTPIPATLAAALAGANKVRVTLRGPGISAVTAGCSWSPTSKRFRCVVKIPARAETGSSKRYSVTAYENPGTGFLAAPPTGSAVNPEYIRFK